MVRTTYSQGKLSKPIIFPSSSLSPPRATGAYLILSLSFLPDSVWIFLYSLGCRRVSLPVSFVFSKNYSTCRCIFDVSVGGCELCALLCHINITLQYLSTIFYRFQWTGLLLSWLNLGILGILFFLMIIIGVYDFLNFSFC